MYIPVTDSKRNMTVYALVDDDMAEEVGRFRWRLFSTGYAIAYANGNKTFMHHLVAGKPVPGLEIDHVNQDKLDNRRNNLRVATHKQNMSNRRIFSNNRSGYKGVYLDRHRGSWRATITVDGKNRHIGRFGSAPEAALAYDSEAVKSFGAFAKVNG